MNATRSGYMEIFANCLPDESLKKINEIADNSIPDVQSEDTYAPAVYKLYRAGILTGVDKQPQSYATRKETDADFFVSVRGGKKPYKFQWYYCNANASSFTRCEDAAEWYTRYSITSDGGNYSVLTVHRVGEYMNQDGAMYYCIITDADGNTVISDTAILTLKL